MNVTDTLADVATEWLLNVYAATGDSSPEAIVAYAVPEPQALTPFTEIFAVPVPDVRLILLVVLEPLHPVPVTVQS